MGTGNGQWDRGRVRDTICVLHREEEMGKGIGEDKQGSGLGSNVVELYQGTEAGNCVFGLDRGTGIENWNGNRHSVMGSENGIGKATSIAEQI